MLLAIDTATRAISLALHDGQSIRCELSWQTQQRHTVELAPAIRDVCARVGITPRDLTKIAVCQGPGSFSGLRVGIAAAKWLAMALNVKLVAIPTLEIVAAGVAPYPVARLIAVAAAGRGRVCMAHYEWKSDTERWQPVSEVQIIAWQPLLDQITTPTILAGEIDTDAGVLIRQAGKPIHLLPASANVRRAAVLADLALELPGQDAAEVLPIYVNQPGLPHP
jgi:tRNA threonylcarbamoyladenosine biosynthesis protein TsaB